MKLLVWRMDCRDMSLYAPSKMDERGEIVVCTSYYTNRIAEQSLR